MFFSRVRHWISHLCLAGVCVLHPALHANDGLTQLVPLGDLNTTQAAKQVVGSGASVQNLAYFAAADSEHGTEVWRYTGSYAVVSRDVRPGPESSNPSQFTAVGNYVVYVADDGVHGPELYTSADINATGLLADVQPGSTHAAPTILGASNGYLWFTTPPTAGSSPPLTTELWITNGTQQPFRTGYFAENSITQVTLLPTGDGMTRPGLVFLARPYGAPAGYLYLFVADSSGNVSQIALLRVNPATPIPAAPCFAVTTDFVCYQRIDNNTVPWVYSFSNHSWTSLGNAGATSQPTNFVSNGKDTICFAATSSAAGREVWTTQGTAEQTTLLADVAAGATSSNPDTLMMSLGNPGVFFQVDSSSGHRDLYFADPGANPVFKKYDSSVEGTQQHTIVSAREIAYTKPEASSWQIKLADGTSSSSANLGGLFTSVSRLWNNSNAVPKGSGLLVIATTNAQGEELYQRSGSSLNPFFFATSPDTDSSKPRQFFPYLPATSNDQLFIADTSSTQGRLFRLQNGGVSAITQIPPSDISYGNASSLPDEFTEVNGSLLFTANDGQNRRLFLTGTAMQNSLSAVAGIYDPEQLTAFQDRLFLLGYGTTGGTGAKLLFEVVVEGGCASASLVNGPKGYNVSALKLAAGRLFFVERLDSTIERLDSTIEQLNSLDADFTVTTVGTFDLDASGTGIAQLTASSGHLYFTGQQKSSPTAERLLWGTDGTAASLGNVSSSILNPQLLGSLGDACVFWFDQGNNNYTALTWDADSGNAPAQFYSGPMHDTPERHRISSRDSGIAVNNLFYFTSRSGTVFQTDGTVCSPVLSNSSLTVRPETLSTLSGSLLFMATTTDSSCLLFSFTAPNMLQQIWAANAGSPPCPMIAAGGRLYFTATNTLSSSFGMTDLWSTDGTIAGTKLVEHGLASRALANVAMGTFRNHLVLAAADSYSPYGLEPALLNYLPVIPEPAPLTGTLRNQPFHFTYEQIVDAMPTDPDGDPLTPLQLYSGEGTLLRNGLAVSGSIAILPGDQFDWTPPLGQSGFVSVGLLGAADDWGEGWNVVHTKVKSPHDLWTGSHFTAEELADPDISSALSDPNHNGVPNALEFIFGRDPKLPDPTPGWAPSVVTPAGGGAAVMRFSFTRAAVLTEGTILEIEGSSDLTAPSWNTLATKIENGTWESTATLTEETLPDGRVEVHVEVPLGSPCAFFRLKATL